MNRKFLILFTFPFLLGCGQFQRSCASATGTPSTVCFEGVVYLQFTSGSSIALNPDGTPKTCTTK